MPTWRIRLFFLFADIVYLFTAFVHTSDLRFSCSLFHFHAVSSLFPVFVFHIFTYFSFCFFLFHKFCAYRLLDPVTAIGLYAVFGGPELVWISPAL